MRSVEQVQLEEIPERPYRLGNYPNRGMRRRYVPDWGDDRAGQRTAHAVLQAGSAGGWIAELGIVPHETMGKKVDEQLSASEISKLEFRELVAQCSILVGIAGIVLWLVVVSG